MADIIKMPRLSDTMTEGTLAKWLKKVGDEVAEGDILAEIETDKATMEFESFSEGVLLHIGLQEGESAPVDSLLAVIGVAGEDVKSLLSGVSEEVVDDPNNDASVLELNESSPLEETAQVVIPEGVVMVSMPRLSDTMTEGVVANWLKKVGDEVAEGDILAEIETDKATMEFESFNEGILLHIGIEEGKSAPVDSLIAIIGPEGTDVEPLLGVNVATISSDPVVDKETSQPSVISQDSELLLKSTQSTKPVKKVSAVDLENGRVLASPLARKLADERGIHLAKVAGTGDGGRIVKVDIENFVDTVSVREESASSLSVAGVETVEKVKNSQMRKVIAKRLRESKFTAPHYYLGLDIDMDVAIEARKSINAMEETKVSFNDMVVKACAMALKQHPQINTSWTPEETIYNKHVSIGVAVAVEDGLLVPVVPFTDTLGIKEIGIQVKDKAIKAKKKKLTPDEMEGSTFTISNLGMFGITEFTSIINQPNSAILSVGGIKQQPVVKEGQIVVGNIMKVTLACDHRTIDGAAGSAFLNTFKQFMENPVTMLA